MDRFREFVADGLVIDPGIVGRAHNGNYRGDASGAGFAEIGVRAEQRRRRWRFGWRR